MNMQERNVFCDAILESMIDCAIVSMDCNGRINEWSEGAHRIFGWDRTETIGRSIGLLFTTSEREAGAPEAEMRKALKRGQTTTERQHLRKDGMRFTALSRMTALIAEDGQHIGFVQIVTDTTHISETEEALRNSDDRLQLAMQTAGILGVWNWDIASGKVYANPRCAELFLTDPEKAAAGMPVADFFGHVHPDDSTWIEAEVKHALETGGDFIEEYRLQRPDGSIPWIFVRAKCYVDDSGKPERFVGVASDISDRKRTDKALRESDADRELALQIADLGRWDHDWADGGRSFDARARTMMGFKANEKITSEHALAIMHPDDYDRVSAAAYNAADQERRGHYSVEYRIFKADTGEERWISANGRTYFEYGRCVRFTGVMADITDRKRSEQELATSREALRIANMTLEQRIEERTLELQIAEAALRQSQKMEAIGQLTGGIAHDFNNLLTGIIGSLDLIRRRIGEGKFGDIDRFMDAASTSANRAASLTHRLLAFSRRQPLDPKPVNIGLLIQSMEDLLLRTLGEHIVLVVSSDPDLWLAKTDANQLESGLLNLGINARDAMPDGGRLTIEASNCRLDECDMGDQEGLEPGNYIVISVSDTGIGMTLETLSKAFDPFFTTKAIGQGTGLGLSMVYGFAKQSGGHVRLYSEVGRGTTVKLYLPRHKGDAADQDHVPSEIVPRGAGQTILLVEDDPAVRMLVTELLNELGYSAIQTADAQNAIPILESDRPIGLLISDVGLPGMNGRQLADVARRLRPELRILFISGYAEKATLRSSFLAPGMDMIIKPFAMNVLAAKIGEMVQTV